MSARARETKRPVLALLGVGLAALGASCALPFWSLPVDRGAGGSSSTSSTGSQGGATPVCMQPGAPRCGTDTEQCNDGGFLELDGCDEACGYEVVQRMDTLFLSNDQGPSFCKHPDNAFGSAISDDTLKLINQSVAINLDNGGVNILAHFHCLSDLTGTNASGFTVGVVAGLIDTQKGLWTSSTAPEDWSFLADGAAVSGGTENYQLAPASIVNHALLAGPSPIVIDFPLAGIAGKLTLDNAMLSATVSATQSRPQNLPMTVADDLLVFDSMGAGALCGDITAKSLAQIAVPAQVAAVCSQGYVACAGDMVVGPDCNSLLDVLVVGCTYGSAPVMIAVTPTQPNVPGEGAVKTLTAGAKNKVTVPSDDDDAYSSYFKLSMVRQHISGETCSTSANCQSAQTCDGSVCSPR